MYWFEKNCFVLYFLIVAFSSTMPTAIREKKVCKIATLTVAIHPWNSYDKLKQTLADANEANNFLFTVACRWFILLPKYQLLSHMKAKLRLFCFFIFGQIMLLFVKNVFDEIEKGNVQKQKQKTATHGICNWIHRRKSFHITKT